MHRKVWEWKGRERGGQAPPPRVRRHSGLAEVAAGLEAHYPAAQRHLTSFETGDTHDLAAKLRELLELPAGVRAALGGAARRAAVERWSWTIVATRLLAPFEGG